MKKKTTEWWSSFFKVMKLSDRVLVMYEGKIMGVVDPKEVTAMEMGLMMGGTPYSEIKKDGNH